MSEQSESPAPRLARPYTLVGGRTRSAVPKLPLETLVWAVDGAASPDDGVRARLVEHCRGAAQSVAELAALLDAPVGVTRVLIGDLVADGLLEVNKSGAPAGDGAVEDVDLLKRVLANVERL